jgi:uroporphyrinogen-III synthase
VKPPLPDLRVVVTRGAHQAAGLAAALAEAGARVELLPLLEIAPPTDPRALERAASELPLYDWLVLTSANAVAAFLALAGGALPRRLQVAAVGPATARALRGAGVEPSLIAAAARGEGLVAALAPRLGRQQRVLLPQAADANPALALGLAAAGAEVVAVAAYEKRLPESAPAIAERLFRRDRIGWVTFASGSAARNFASLFGDPWPERRPELRAASIGPVTSAALRALGVEPAAEAAQPSDRELVRAIVKQAGQTAA